MRIRSHVGASSFECNKHIEVFDASVSTVADGSKKNQKFERLDDATFIVLNDLTQAAVSPPESTMFDAATNLSKILRWTTMWR